MAWKRSLHAEQRTTLIESTWWDIVMAPSGLDRLGKQLEAAGLVLNWDPSRAPVDSVALTDEAAARLFRSFMSHVKANSLTRADLEARLRGERSGLASSRLSTFLDLYWPIHEEWNRRLRSENLVDFDDMLVLAAQHVENGDTMPPYDMLMVDEFQDSSQTRARLVAGVLKPSGRYLLAVGDDWQAINRFAGADLSILTNFTDVFGAGPTLQLSTTFRSTQTICDVAARFVSKNKQQLKKSVKSATGHAGEPVRVVQTRDPKATVRDELKLMSGHAAALPSGRASVLLLGRYNFDREMLPDAVPENLDVEFRTVHSSKGLESDFVIIPRVVTGRLGFPSTVEDDPALSLAMAVPDTYAHAEERRLFYVALTRARLRVVVLAEVGRESEFVVELTEDKGVQFVQLPADEKSSRPGAAPTRCNECNDGVMRKRKGRFGLFLGCSKFPACRNTRNL